jgi:putative oxidoreductase
MSLLKQIHDWTQTHNPKWLALFRVALGASLLLRGVTFLNNIPDLEMLISDNNLGSYKNLLINTIPWVHIVGGFLIIIGLFTRFAAFVQIPILLGAIIFVNAQRGLFTTQTDLTLSIIVLLLLFVFVVEGSGPLSLSYYFKEEQEAERRESEVEA